MGLEISTEYWILFDIWFEIQNISYDYRNSIFDSIFDLKVPFVICFEHFKKVPFVQHCLEMRKLGTVRVRLCVCRSCTLTSSEDDKIVVFNWHFFYSIWLSISFGGHQSYAFFSMMFSDEKHLSAIIASISGKSSKKGTNWAKNII